MHQPGDVRLRAKPATAFAGLEGQLSELATSTGLSTVTYLFDGEIHHRDSLGVSQKIRAGEVNWLTAGSGIVKAVIFSLAGPPPFSGAGLASAVTDRVATACPC